jgi:hypothetical protein
VQNADVALAQRPSRAILSLQSRIWSSIDVARCWSDE